VLELAAERSLGIDAAMLEPLSDTDRLRLVHARMVEVGLVPRRSRPESLRGSLRAFGTCLRAHYEPRRMLGENVHFVLVADSRLDDVSNQRRHDRACAEWKRFVPDLAHWRGPGNHMTILRDPHVRQLADWWLTTVQTTVSLTA
jgi:hypothetical protein